MDMTTPAQPLPLSFTVLSGTPTAVVLNGNTAIVGYSTDTSDLFDLTNPGSPLLDADYGQTLSSFFSKNSIQVSSQNLLSLEITAYNSGVGTIERAFTKYCTGCTSLDDLVKIPAGGEDASDTALWQSINDLSSALGLGSNPSNQQILNKFNEINNYSRQILATAASCTGGT
jgi:hypothetical protein